MPRARSKPTKVFHLKVILQDTNPPIWRDLLVPSNIALGKLHTVLQAAFGWTNSHLHQFEIRDRLIGDIRMNEEDGPDVEDERRIHLDQLVGVGQRLLYLYDFGDSWHHQILVAEALEPDRRQTLPLCIGGARACPPEDCGGTGGYERLLEILTDPKHEEHDETLTWVGGYWDAEGLDANRTNRALGVRP